MHSYELKNPNGMMSFYGLYHEKVRWNIPFCVTLCFLDDGEMFCHLTTKKSDECVFDACMMIWIWTKLFWLLKKRRKIYDDMQYPWLGLTLLFLELLEFISCKKIGDLRYSYMIWYAKDGKNKNYYIMLLSSEKHVVLQKW